MERHTVKQLARFVDNGASGPDLPLAAGEHGNPPHVHHGHPKVVEESLLRTHVAVHEHFGGTVPKQGLVRVEEALLLRDKAVVGGVERRRAPRHHLQLRLVVLGIPALLPQRRCIRHVQGRIRVVASREVTQPLLQRWAVRAPQRMGT